MRRDDLGADSEAAEQWRLTEARHLVSHITVLHQQNADGSEAVTRAPTASR
jgi:hypothetical protein